MLSGEKISVLVPAAGQGERLGRGPKGLLEIDDRPLVSWLCEKVQRLEAEVLVAVPPGMEEIFQRYCPGCRCITGGATRQESVALLAQEATGARMVLADVARPFVTLEHYRQVIEASRETGVAGAFLDPEVPVAEIRDGKLVRVLARSESRLFQAPQAFSREVLIDVLGKAEAAGWRMQSTLELAVAAGYEVSVVAGEKNNIKLTTPEDWPRAEHLKSFLS